MAETPKPKPDQVDIANMDLGERTEFAEERFAETVQRAKDRAASTPGGFHGVNTKHMEESFERYNPTGGIED